MVVDVYCISFLLVAANLADRVGPWFTPESDLHMTIHWWVVDSGRFKISLALILYS